MSATSVAKNVLKTLDNNSPLILTGIAVAGVVTTAVLAVRATPEAIAEVEKQKLRNDLEDASKLEWIKWSWQHYIPALGMGAVTIACMIGAQSVNSRRQAFLISGYTLTETAFREYREKAVEALGAQKEQKLRDEIASEKVAANPPGNQVFITGPGDVLCYDTISGRYFMSDVERIRQAQNDINQKCINEMYASQNDFYSAIGLPINGYGEEFGWSTDVMLDVQFSAMVTEDKRPAIVIDYRMSPIRGYNTFG